MKSKNLFFAFAAASLLFSSCTKEEENKPVVEDNGYNVPSTYEFTRDGQSSVSYTGQIDRLNMLDEMSAYMEQGAAGEFLSASTLSNMYKNENSPFEEAELNSSTKNLASKTYSEDEGLFSQYFLNIENTSADAGNTASNGNAGVLYNNDQSKQYLVDENGIEWRQVILKHMMGAVFYYQTVSVYLSDSKIGNSVDNSNIVEGKNYTTMEHHFDEAFGYFGVPTDFSTNTEGVRYYGKYANKRNDVLGSNNAIMSAFLKGRAAIVNKDMAGKDAAIAEIKKNLELVIAGSAIHYLNEAIANFDDDGVRSHVLSEGLGFVRSLKYNGDKLISNTDLDNVEVKIGDNFYNVTVQGLNEAKAILVNAYGLDDVKDIL